MEGNSSDSISSRSGASSFSPRSTPFIGDLPAAGIVTRTRSVAESESAYDSANIEPKIELGDDASQGETESPFSAPIGERTYSPLRRGPGRPRKETVSNLPARGKTQASRMRGGRGRLRSQFSARRLSVASQASKNDPIYATTSADFSSVQSSPSVSAYYGTETGSTGEDESQQISDASSSANKDQRCAFCYLTQSSRLGQGDLVRHSPTPGFNLSAVPKKPTPRSSSPTADTISLSSQESSADSAAGPSATEQLTLRINLKHSKVVRIKKKADVSKEEQEPFDEIDKLGLPDDIELTDLFESTGHCWAHHCCASWSDGVVQSDTFALLHVDSAAVAAMTQKCAGCSRTGASITCRSTGCGRKYHYPCASTFGGFQDIKTLAFLCPYHLDEVPALPDANAACGKCETIGDVSSQLFCTSCGDHYHADCLEPPVGTGATVRAGWQCPECKMCQHCQRYGDDSRMLVCDSCDKGYHVYCMQPPMTTIPKSGWKCKNCRVCTDCGSRTPGNGPSSRWHLNYSICDSCYQQRNKGLYCPLCERAYRHLKLKSMRQCANCKKYVHLDCIRKSHSLSAYESSSALSTNPGEYICPICQGAEISTADLSMTTDNPNLAQQFGTVPPESETTPSSSISEENEEAEAEMLAIFIKNEMAGGGESLSGTESPFLELDALGDMDVDGVMQLLQPEEAGDISTDVSLSTSTLESKRGRGGATAGLKKQAGLPRKRISVYGRRTKSTSGSSSGTGNVRGGGSFGERKRIGRGGGGGGRGGGQRAAITALQTTLQNIVSNHNNGCATKKKEEDEYIHTVVVSANDEFVFGQDICVICGSFGSGPEGHFIACMQCGQCYHPYCANITINAAILRRGWRCLDCTVCEGCGRGDDEKHLLLCDDCDISFHTYCLDPPLDSIPAGPWVCKWCSSCQICGTTLRHGEGTTSPSKVCPRCESVIACSMCHLRYADGEYVMQCENCERWCHCKCDGLLSEEAIDRAADKGYKCYFCRPNSVGSAGQEMIDGRVTGTGKTVDLAFHVVMDGVSLTKSGLRTIQWRPRRKGLGPAVNAPPATSTRGLDDVIDSVHAFVTRGIEDHGSGTGEDLPSEDRPDANDMERLNVDTNALDTGVPTGDPFLLSPADRRRLARQKKYFKVGVGGFLVRHTRQRTSNEKADDSQDIQDVAAELAASEDGRESAAGEAPLPAVEKPKKRKRQNRKQVKVQLEESYPSYIQDAFFGSTGSHTDDNKTSGMASLDERDSPLIQTKIMGDNELESVAPPPVVKPAGPADKNQITDQRRGDPHSQTKSVPLAEATHQGRRQSASHQHDPIGEGFDDLGEDIFPHPIDDDIHHQEFTNLIDMLMGDGDMDPVGAEDDTQRHSPNLENLIDSRDYVGIGEVDTAEMDRLMGNMLDDELRGTCDGDTTHRQSIPAQHHPVQQSHQHHVTPGQHSQIPTGQNQSMIPSSVYHQHQQQTHFVHDQFTSQQVEPDHQPSHNPYGVPIHNQLQAHDMVEPGQDPSRFLSTPQQCSQPSTAPPTPSPSLAHEFASSSASQSSMNVLQSYSSLSPKGDQGSSADAKNYLERWEPDESLGERATIAAVLYANMNYPDLRTKYPSWTERAKQIAKLWRLLALESRQPYVQMARENRAVCRQLNKTKKASSVDNPMSTSVPSSPDIQSIDRSTFPGTTTPQMQDYKPSPFGGPVMAQPYPGANQQILSQSSNKDEFKVPQRPPSSIGHRPDLLKRCDSMPQTGTVQEQIKTEPYVASQSGQSPCAAGSATSTPHGTYNPYSLPPGPFDQQYDQQSTDWNRCQPSLLEDFIEMERRERSRQGGPVGLLTQGEGKMMGTNLVGQWANQQQMVPGQNFPFCPTDTAPVQQRLMQQPPMNEAAGPAGSTIPRDRQHEEWLSSTQRDYEVQVKGLESELNQMRKNKKNIGAKQRQLKKNGQELSIDDTGYLARLTQEIAERQKHLEHLRKQSKQHNNLVQDYNVKHGLPTSPMVSSGTSSAPRPPTSLVTSPIMPPSTPGHLRGPPCGMDAFEPFQQLGSQSSTPTTPPHQARFPAPVQRRISHGEAPGQFAETFGRPDQVLPQQPYGHLGGPRPVYPGHQTVVSPMSMAFPHVSATRPPLPSSALVTPQPLPTPVPEQKKKKKYYAKKKPDTSKDTATTSKVTVGRNLECQGLREPESPCPQSNLLAMAPECDTDVVVTVSYLLDRTVAELDGPSGTAASERENVLLKQLLDSSSPNGIEDKKKPQPVKRSAPYPSAQASPRKRNRKVGNAAVGAGVNSKGKSGVACSQSAAEADAAFLEQLATQLRSLPPLPIQEPTPRSDPLISNSFGITNLVQRSKKQFIVGPKPGEMRLTFMPDYYLDVFDKPPKQQRETIQQRQPHVQSFQNSFSTFPNSYEATSNRPTMALQQPNQVQQQQLLIRSPGTMYGMGGQPMALPRYTQGQPLMHSTEPEIRSMNDSPLEVVYSDATEYEDLLPTYPGLKPVVPAEGRLSPNFRLVAPVPMRAVPPDPPAFFDKVMPPMPSMDKPRDEDVDMVNVTLTLDIGAAQRVHEVLQGLAALLQIDVPQQFEVHIDTPPQTPDKAFSKTSMEMEYRQQSVTVCRNCEIAVQQASFRKKLAELGLTPKEDDTEEVIFCGQHCYDQFTNRLKVREADSQILGKSVLEDSVKPITDPGLIGTIAASVERTGTVSVESSTSLLEPQHSTSKQNGESKEENRLDEIIKSVLGDSQSIPLYGSKEELFHVKDLPKYKDSGEDVTRSQAYEKRWKGTKWKSWQTGIGATVMAVVMRSMDTMYLEASQVLFRPSTLPSDVRVCEFCATVGDGPMETTGRLLNLDAGRWVHVNCALWSAEVYERVEGALVNVEQAVRRASSDPCFTCQRYGASVPCYKLRCGKSYHFPCAVQAGCTFLKDKTMLCPHHAIGTSTDVVLTSLAVIRRVYIERDENRIIAKLYQQGDSGGLALRVGSLIFGHVGQLLPHQLRNFHVKDFIYPVGYAASRIYWSSKDVRQRNIYRCTISDHDGQPSFNVTYHEEGFADVAYSGPSASDAWSGILRPLEQLRVERGMLSLFPTYLPGEALFGLTESSIVKMIESLPGVDMMLRYECKYGRSPLIDLPLAVNPSGCARCEPRFRTYIKRSHTHTASTAGSFQSLLAMSGLSTELNFYQYGGNRQTLVSKWSQYRKMKQEWQSNVYLARSRIQGLGLYAKRDIEMNAMVIEYIGEVIRNEVAERREKQYQQHNRGIYMFRIDEERVIDATVSGGLARYVNHSCDPNCVAELFEFDREPKIIIMSCRPITKGEELTYDYQFDVEDDSSKIPCLCGAPNCQKWMN